MHLLLGQVVYTSFTGMGFRLLASTQVPTEIQQAFLEGVASQHWDSYEPPKSGYRAVYLHQVTPEHSLFGWLYNDGADDMGRCDVPYFICYYIAGPLHAIQLENIFICLHKGPVALIDRHSIPTTLAAILIRNFWSYQPARPGVAIALGVRRQSHLALNQGELLDVFVAVEAHQMVIELNGQTYEQQRQYIESIPARMAPQRKAVSPLEKFGGAIKSKDVVTVKALNAGVAVKEANTSSLMTTTLPHILSTRQSLKRSSQQTDHRNSVLAYRTSQFLLRIGIVATILALTGSIYALVQISILTPSKSEFIPSENSSVLFHILPSPYP
jgi:phosphate transport system substrate-binding protein